jgi:hypothetical protein
MLPPSMVSQAKVTRKSSPPTEQVQGLCKSAVSFDVGQRAKPLNYNEQSGSFFDAGLHQSNISYKICC